MNHTIRYLDHTGDTCLTFADTDVKAKAEAKALFDRLTKAGQPAFAVKRAGGAEDMKITSFDQIENETIIIPRIAGG